MKGLLNFFKQVFVFLLKCVGIVAAKIMIITGEVLSSIGKELEKNLK